MKPTKKMTGRILIVLVLSCFTLALVSWNGLQKNEKNRQGYMDTIPKKPAEPKNLDEALQQLDNIDLKEIMEGAQLQMEKALKEIDGEKIRLQVEKAMKEVDFEKIQSQIRESLAKVDLEKLKVELGDAMKEVDFEKLQAELKESMKEIDLEKMKKEMEKFHDIDMKKMEADLAKMKDELKDLRPRLEKELASAKIEIEKAKTEIKEFKGFVDGLEKDGLIDKKQGYTLKHEDGELFINGKKASSATYEKYREFLQKHKKFNLIQDDEKFNLDK